MRRRAARGRTRARQAVVGDAGFAVIWALALSTVVMAVGLVGMATALRAAERARVGGIADVAALAGAQADWDPCAAAAAVVTANGMSLMSCDLEDADVVVTVTDAVDPLVEKLWAALGQRALPVRVTARAGPP